MKRPYADAVGEWIRSARRVAPETPSVDVDPNELAEIEAAFEELRVAEEELRVQNEQLEEVLQDAQAERRRYQELFELAPDPYVMTDALGVVRAANRAALELLGRPPASVLEKPLAVFTPTDDRPLFRARLAQAARLEAVPEWEMRLGREKEATVPVSVRVAAHTSTSHEPELLWLLRDLRERNAAQENALRAQRENAARRAAEDAREQATFLADAAEALWQARGLAQTAECAATLAVAHLADFAFVDLADGSEGALRRAAAHVTEGLDGALPTLRRGSDGAITAAPARHVLRSGEPEILPEVQPRALRSWASGTEEAEALEALDARTLLVLPLRAAGRTLGVLTLGRTGEGRLRA